MNERKGISFPMVGVSSLLVIFSVLCLTVFALLSVSTMRANQKLSEKSLAATAGYYKADYEAEEILARLRAGERPPGVKEEQGIYTYYCTISDTQQLVVEVAVEGSDYQIIRWQTESTAVWQPDDSLPVWKEE